MIFKATVLRFFFCFLVFHPFLVDLNYGILNGIGKGFAHYFNSN